MDETDNKKRRNLMLTASAILIAAFLGIKFPSVAISSYAPQEIALIPFWKFWAVALVIVTYQLWRFCTDSQTTALLENTKLSFTNIMRESLSKEISVSVKRALAKPNGSAGPISFLGERPLGDFVWVKARVRPTLAHDDGQPWPLKQLLGRTVQCSVAYTAWSADRLRSSDSGLSIAYQASAWMLMGRIIRSAAKTAVGSSHCQDVLIPVALGALSVATCAWKLLPELISCTN